MTSEAQSIYAAVCVHSKTAINQYSLTLKHSMSMTHVTVSKESNANGQQGVPNRKTHNRIMQNSTIKKQLNLVRLKS